MNSMRMHASTLILAYHYLNRSCVPLVENRCSLNNFIQKRGRDGEFCQTLPKKITYRVYHGFGLHLGERSKIINLGSLWTIFAVSSIFEAAGEKAKNWPKLNQSTTSS